MIIVTWHQAGRKVNKDDAQHRGRRSKARRGTRICFLSVCVFAFSIKFSTIYSGLIESLGECTTGIPTVAPRCPQPACPVWRPGCRAASKRLHWPQILMVTKHSMSIEPVTQRALRTSVYGKNTCADWQHRKGWLWPRKPSPKLQETFWQHVWGRKK